MSSQSYWEEYRKTRKYKVTHLVTGKVEIILGLSALTSLLGITETAIKQYFNIGHGEFTHNRSGYHVARVKQ